MLRKYIIIINGETCFIDDRHQLSQYVDYFGYKAGENAPDPDALKEPVTLVHPNGAGQDEKKTNSRVVRSKGLLKSFLKQQWYVLDGPTLEDIGINVTLNAGYNAPAGVVLRADVKNQSSPNKKLADELKAAQDEIKALKAAAKSNKEGDKK